MRDINGAGYDPSVEDIPSDLYDIVDDVHKIVREEFIKTILHKIHASKEKSN